MNTIVLAVHSAKLDVNIPRHPQKLGTPGVHGFVSKERMHANWIASPSAAMELEKAYISEMQAIDVKLGGETMLCNHTDELTGIQCPRVFDCEKARCDGLHTDGSRGGFHASTLYVQSASGERYAMEQNPTEFLGDVVGMKEEALMKESQGDTYAQRFEKRKECKANGQERNLPRILVPTAKSTCEKKLTASFKKKIRKTGLQRTFDVKFYKRSDGKIQYVGMRPHKPVSTHPQMVVHKFYKHNRGCVMTKLN